jgi:Rieske Fe-S protein
MTNHLDDEADGAQARHSCHADCTSRRSMLVGAGAAGLLAGCQSYGDEAAQTPAASQPAPGASTAGTAAAPTDQPAAALAKTSDIPVGGGKIIDGDAVVITQPVAGTFKAFSAICTHQGCVVSGVANGKISCGCHGSEFKISDGSVLKGPATKKLPETKIVVSGDSITLA